MSERAATVLKHLPRLESSEYTGDTLTVRTFSPEKINQPAHTRGYLRRLDQAIPLELDVDVGSLVSASVGLNGTVVSLTGSSSESIEGIVSTLGESTGTIDSYAVYRQSDTIFAVDNETVMLAKPDDRLSIAPSELVERVIEAESRVETLLNSTATETQTGTLTERESLVRKTLEEVETDHILSIGLPFGEDVFSPETSFTPGARAVAWGLTVEGGPTVVTKFAAEFPDGEASTAPVRESLPKHDDDVTTDNGGAGSGEPTANPVVTDALSDSKYVHIDNETTAVDGNAVTGLAEYDTTQLDTRNPYLRIRGLSNPLVVRIHGKQFEWSFDYPERGVSGITNPKLPAGRPIQFEMMSDDVLHGVYFEEPGQIGIAIPQIPRYSTYSVSEPGERTLSCSEFCGPGHSTMQTVVEFVEPREFEEWVSAA